MKKSLIYSWKKQNAIWMLPQPCLTQEDGSMAVDYENIKSIAKDYADNVKKTLPVNKVILFGSFAKGTATNYSDVDICFFWMILAAKAVLILSTIF